MPESGGKRVTPQSPHGKVGSMNAPFAPHDFWQRLEPAGHYTVDPPGGYRDLYPALLPDGRQLALPIRVLPGGDDRAVASLILNQASFVVEAGLADALAGEVRALEPDVVVGLPTLGLTLARALAGALGHARYVPLGTSRKFWYREELSAPMVSITSPDQMKRLWLDPRMLPLLEGRRIVLVDDVISTGSSMLAALAVFEAAGLQPAAIGTAMLQTERWKERLGEAGGLVSTVLRSPLLRRVEGGGWVSA